MSVATETLEYLVGCRSHRGHAGWAAESLRALTYVAERLGEAGWRTELDAVAGSPVLSAEREGRDGEAPCLAINGHVDVVSDGDRTKWTSDPWTATARGGRCVGRGVADMKGGIAALVDAAATIGASGSLARRTVVHLVADEEVGGPSSAALAARLAGPVDVLGLEPTELRLAVEEPGVAHVLVEVDGREGHVANRYRELQGDPSAGVNAIERAAAILGALRELERRWSEKPSGKLPPGFNTIAPARMHGSSGGGRDGRCLESGSPSVTPDYCALDLNVWYLPHERAETVRAEIEAVVGDGANAGARSGDVPARVTWAKEYHVPPFRTSTQAEFTRTVAAAVEASGGAAELVAFPAASDVPRYAEIARASMLFGPGSLAQAHRENEAIDLAEIATASRVLAHLLTNPTVDP